MTISQGILAAEAPASTLQGFKKLQVVTTETASPDTQDVENKRYLVVSPYPEKEHLLDLETLDKENQLLALALMHLKCLREDYATAPYLQTFNWGDIIDTLRALAREHNHAWKETSWYIVAFRSQIPPTTVYAELGMLDKAAHAEATASGGFLKCVTEFLLAKPQGLSETCTPIGVSIDISLSFGMTLKAGRSLTG